jgi:hypothetical protein
VPVSEADKNAVLEQVDLLQAHPLFSQSKRYPVLLRFVVEQVLQGTSDQVKERLIGMEVFGRPPGYDANADPVVRVTAGEIRKRLAQYYYDPLHLGEIRVELPTGSYVPVFLRWREPAEEAALPASHLGSPSISEPGPADPTSPQPPQSGPLATPARSSAPAKANATASPAARYPPALHQPIVHHTTHTTHPILMLLLVVVTLLLGVGVGYGYRRYRESRIPAAIDVNRELNRDLNDFWQPLTAGPATVTICLGEPARDSSGDTDPAQAIRHAKLAEPLYFRLRQSGLFALADVTTLTRTTGVLQRQGKAFRVSAASEASFAQLREGPAVFIGAFDNLWTMRLTRDLRFGFDSIDGNAFIVDRKSKTKTTWFTAWDLPYQKLARDYAIVARFKDPLTGQPVVLASGISEEGTVAAGELISEPADLAGLLKNAPANWRNMNIEAVIETQVIDGHSGPPQVLAVEFW